MGTRVNNNTEIKLQEVSRVRKAPEAKTLSVPMVSEKANKAGNVDGIKVQTRTKEQIYKMIEDICVDYRMSMEDVKKVGLLEKISGLSTEELCKKSNVEINQYIDTLKNTLKYLSWKFPWQDRGINDIEKIANQANERTVYLKTGRNFVGNLFRSKATLQERLKKDGLELNEDGVKTYFQNLISSAIASGDKEKIKKAYADAYVVFGDLLNDTKVPEHKALLVAAIEKLEASAREQAVDLAFISCKNEKGVIQRVARGIGKSFEKITASKDAFGARTTSDNNKNIAVKAFSKMSEEDAALTLSEMKERRNELEQKKQSANGLEEDEDYFYNFGQIDEYAGATVGLCCNNYVEDKTNLISTLHNDVTELGIQEQVYSAANAYAEQNATNLPINKETFTTMMDKATQNEYSRVVAQVKANGISQNTKSQQTGEPKQDAESSNAKVSTVSKTTEQLATENEIVTSFNAVPASNKVETGSKTSAQSFVQHPGPQINQEPQIEVSAKTQVTLQNPIENNKVSTAFDILVQTGSVKDVKKFAESNNISHEKLTIEILNSSTANSYLKDWALEQFDKMNDSMKNIYFARLEKNDSIIAAAKLMNTEQLQHMNFNSFFIKQSVDDIIETREQKEAC